MDQKPALNDRMEHRAPTRKVRPALRFAVGVVIMLGALFGSAGRLDWVGAWLYVIVYSLLMVLLFPTVRRQPGLIEERTQAWKKAQPWDRVYLMLMGIACPVATILVAGLDVRFQWSVLPSPALQALGLAMFIAGTCLGWWAIASNSFFSSVVRIQDDRGHVVATGGPYAYLRHPGYAGGMLSAVGVPLLLGSACALVPGFVGLAGIVARTAIEDRFLRDRLAGYQDYADRVRFRLVPGMWKRGGPCWSSRPEPSSPKMPFTLRRRRRRPRASSRQGTTRRAATRPPRPRARARA